MIASRNASSPLPMQFVALILILYSVLYSKAVNKIRVSVVLNSVVLSIFMLYDVMGISSVLRGASHVAINEEQLRELDDRLTGG